LGSLLPHWCEVNRPCQEKCSPEREEKLNLSIESLENVADINMSNLPIQE